MRKSFTAAALAALVIGVLAAPAGAQTVTKFSVITLTKSSHPSGGSIIVRSRLVEPAERNEVLGHGLAKVHASRPAGPGSDHLLLRRRFAQGEGRLRPGR